MSVVVSVGSTGSFALHVETAYSRIIELEDTSRKRGKEKKRKRGKERERERDVREEERQ